MNVPSRTDIAAIVVLYNPSADVLGNIDSYSDQVDLVIAVDNSDSSDEALRARLVERGVLHISMGGNRGIAAALNTGCRRALALGYGWALTMDQDSTATPGLVPALSGVLADEDSATIAIVAPAWEPVGGAPIQLFSDVCDLDYAMTSGNLLRLSAFESLGGFREDFFIDHVDNEFCLRARTSGWRVVQRRDAVLSHRPGRMGRVTFPFSFYTLNYSPTRRYYMVRNLFEMSREFGPTFPGWLSDERRHWRKDLLKMLLGEDQRCLKLRMMYQGWSDFRKHRFGSYDDLHPRGGRRTAR